MKIFKIILHLLLLCVTPITLIYPQEPLKPIPYERAQMVSHYPLSYDAIMDLIDEIESGELEKRINLYDLENLNGFLAKVAQEGQLADGGDDPNILAEDVEELLMPFYQHAIYRGMDNQYQILPGSFNSYSDLFLCKSNLWAKTKKFVEKHKKAIIIGAIVVVAVVAVVAVAVATSSAAVAAGAAGAAGASGVSKCDPSEHSLGSSTEPLSDLSSEVPTLHQALQGEVASFKEHLVKEEFFVSAPPTIHDRELSWKENGRTLGSLFAHESLKNITEKIAENPQLAGEVCDMDRQYSCAIPRVASEMALDFGHAEMDRKFSTDYACLFTGTDNEIDFTTRSYQLRGEKALEYGYYSQAIADFSQVIERDPTRCLPYLERSIARFELGEYESALEDYHSYSATELSETEPLSISEFGLGFTKGLPKGIYDSVEGLFLLFSDLAVHPVHTVKQMWGALSLLAELGLSGEWSTLREVLAPEVYELAREWDKLPSNIRGERAGYLFGKYGSDICIPGAVAKATSKGLKSAKELNIIYKSFQTAEKTLLLESVASLESGGKIAEVIQATQKTLALSEELGMSMSEIAQLKKAGTLESAITHTFEQIQTNPVLSKSLEFFDQAQNFLKPYSKGFLSETQARELIHQTGIRTFPRPAGIPENFRVRITDKGCGIEYMHPTNTHLSVRVMPGKPHSPNLHQQKPYVIQKHHGKGWNKDGDLVPLGDIEAHIPVEDFIYRCN